MHPRRQLSTTGPDRVSGRSPAAVERRRVGRYDWWICAPFGRGDWLEVLEQPSRLLEGGVEPLKRGMARGREVVRRGGEAAPAGDLVVKRFTPRGLRELIKWSWRASPAHRALVLARRMQALGLQTATPIAAGERRRWGWLRESYSITRHMADAAPLYRINMGCADRRRRMRIVRGLARVYATLHDAGFCHCDPSQTNFLAVSRAGGGESVVLIDLDGIRRRGGMGLEESAQDLRRLLVRCQAPRHERAWFIAAYVRARALRIDAHRLVERIGPLPAEVSFPGCALDEGGRPKAADSAAGAGGGEAGTRAVAMGLPVGDRRARTRTTAAGLVETRRRGGMQWLVRVSRLSARVEGILNAPEDFIARGRVLKPSRSSAVSAEGGLVLKRYNLRKWRNAILDLFRGSRARRAFRKACCLELHGIATARPIAAGDERLGLLPLRSYFLMEEIPDAAPLSQWGGDRRGACRTVAGLLGRLHREGFTHRDLKAGNIVFDGDGRPHLIDLDGLRFVCRVSDRRAVDDLARLAEDAAGWPRRISRWECARFLLAYCRARRLSDWRGWWREIGRHLGG